MRTLLGCFVTGFYFRIMNEVHTAPGHQLWMSDPANGEALLPLLWVYQKTQLKAEFSCARSPDSCAGKLVLILESLINVREQPAVRANAYSLAHLQKILSSREAAVVTLYRPRCRRCGDVEQGLERVKAAFPAVSWMKINVDHCPECLQHLVDSPQANDCSRCANAGSVVCSTCGGLGQLVRYTSASSALHELCPTCVGLKVVRCPACGGRCLACI
jgi:hypothetical protein